MSSLRNAGLVVALAVLAAVVIVVANEVLSLASREATIASIYEQQLDAILFSVNQHAWNVVDSWADDVEDELRRASDSETVRTDLALLVEQTDEIDAVFIADSAGLQPVMIRPGPTDTLGRSRTTLLAEALSTAARELPAKSQANYRPLVPLTGTGIDTDSLSIIVFTPESAFSDAAVAGLIIDSKLFVENIIGRRLRDLGGEQFDLSVTARGSQRDLLTGEESDTRKPDIVRPIWVFEDFEVGIRAAGGGIQQLARDRLTRSLALVGLLAAAVIWGIWFLYRNVKRESDLAQLKSDFVSNVSHELRTPLSVISMYAETLRMGRIRDDEKLLEYYRIIGDESERLSHLVSNVLNFSSIAAGKKRYAHDPFDLGDVVRDVSDAYRSHLERDGFELEVDVEDRLIPVIGDRGATKEAVINLIDNAVKYSRSDRFIGLSCTVENGSGRIAVRDRGVGIDVREQENIFDKFYRAERGLVHDVKGTGLGLALVQHIMQGHGGRVHVTSRPGAGSTFVLEFPLRDIPGRVPETT